MGDGLAGPGGGEPRLDAAGAEERELVVVAADREPGETGARGGYGTRLLRSLSRQAEAKMETTSDPGRGTRVSLNFLAS